MKVHGYCAGCHKIKRVTVRIPVGRGVQVGVCDDCVAKGKR